MINKPRRKTAKLIIASYALVLITLIAAVVSALSLNIELAAVCILAFGLSSLVCFIACVIGFIILFTNNEGTCASAWVASLVATAILPVQPESVGFDLSTVAALGFLGCTIWGVNRLWFIGGQVE